MEDKARGVTMRRSPARRERGQVFVIAAILIVPLVAVAGLAVDLGYAYLSVRDAQNAADAAAMAGAIEMLQADWTEADVTTAVESAAAQNGVDVAEDLECCAFQDTDGDGRSDQITVTVTRPALLFFLRVIGVDSLTAQRSATTSVRHAAAGPLCPWGLVARGSENPEGDVHWGFETGKVYLLKVDNGLQDNGNFHGMRVGGGGVSVYRSTIEAGCTADTFGIYSEGDEIYVDTQPGNLGAATRDGLNTLYDYERTDGIYDSQGYGYCDVDFTETADPVVGVPLAGEQWEPPRSGCGTDAAGLGRIVLVPIIASLPNGSSDPAQIVGVAAAYVAGWDRTGPPSDTRVHVVFMEHAVFDPRWLSGESDNPLSPLRPVLTQ